MKTGVVKANSTEDGVGGRVAGWIPLYPWWYVAERERMQKHFPHFTASEAELAKGVLAYKGTLTIDLGSRVVENHVLMLYEDETPYRMPSVFPLERLPEGDDWSVEQTIRSMTRRMPKGYRRHQMADIRTPNWCGHLCLLETNVGDTQELISGVVVLRRAKAVFQALAVGRPFPFPDAEADDLEAHFPRHGDILLGDVFFPTDLGIAGKFWAVATFDNWPTLPTYVEQSTFLPRQLYVGLHVVTESASITTNWQTDQTLAIRRAFPFTANGRLSFEAQTKGKGDFLDGAVIEGPWYRLRNEPEPVSSGGELAEVLGELTSLDDGVTELLRQFPQFGDAGSGVAWLGLCYPGREGELKWLFLGLSQKESISKEVRKEEGEGVRRDILRSANVIVMRSHRLARSKLELRNKGTLPATLSDRTVLVIGCGALGGDVAITLANAGVGRLILIDPDIISPGNVIRHVSGLSATGLSKTDAMRQSIYQHNPFVDVEAIPHSATHPRDRIDGLLQRVDLAVCTIADENIEMVVNESAVRIGKTVIYGRALRRGSVARIFRVRPGEDACKACLALYGDGSDVESRSITVPSAEGELLARECGQPILAGSAADLRIAADFTSRAVIDELGGGVEWNNLLWVRVPWPNAPAPVAAPMSILRDLFDPHPKCPVCGRPRVARIVLGSDANRMLRNYAEAKPDVETGGALIGYEEDGVVYVQEVTDSGPRAEETKVRFRYDAEHVNRWLTEAASRLGQRGLYVGEWHTHIESDPEPSIRDITSLSEIAVAPNFLTDEPVMLIAGVDPSTKRVENIHASSFPIGRSMRVVGLTVEPNQKADV